MKEQGLNICVAEKIRVADVFGVKHKLKRLVDVGFHFVQLETWTSAKLVWTTMLFSNLNNHSSPPNKVGSAVINMRLSVI